MENLTKEEIEYIEEICKTGLEPGEDKEYNRRIKELTTEMLTKKKKEKNVEISIREATFWDKWD